MPFAKIVGEVHYSRADLNELLDVDFSQFDAVFVEHHERSDYPLSSNLGLLLFLAAFISYRSIITKTYHEYTEIERGSYNDNVKYEDKIDLNGIQTYLGLGIHWKVLVPIIAFLTSFAFGWIFFSATSSHQIVGDVSLVHLIAPVIFVISFIGLENGLVEFAGSYRRERHMTAEILSRSDRNEYESILLLCGDFHRPMISQLLQQMGWEVEQVSSDSLLASTFWPVRFIRKWILVTLRDPELKSAK